MPRPTYGRNTGRDKAYCKPKVRQADRQANERQVTGRHAWEDQLTAGIQEGTRRIVSQKLDRQTGRPTRDK